MEPGEDIHAVLDRELLSLRELIGDEILEGLLSNPADLNGGQLPVFLEPLSNATLPSTSRSKQPHPSLVPSASHAPDLAPPSTSASSRFGEPISEDKLKEAIEGRVPQNTKKGTNWGISVWRQWCNARNIQEPIESMEASQICSLMAKFVQEARRKDGQEYPASSLLNIVSAIQRYLRENNRPEVSFLSEQDVQFDLLRKSLDARMKDLTRRGIGLNKRQAQPLSPEMEDTLWECGIFSQNTSRGLLNVVFWYGSKMFGLRAADEHRSLEIEQFKIARDDSGKYLRFSGRSCKNYQGGLHHRKVEPKDLKIYVKEELCERCAVSCFEKYMNLLPPKGAFYWKPLGTTPPRFADQPIGINTLRNTVKKFCKEAGFEGQFTNHSGKVTCATELFKHNVDEQLIMRQTGHRSEDAVRRYKRPSQQHDHHVSSILQPPPPKHVQTTNIMHSATNNSLAIFISPAKIPFTITSEENSTQNIYITIN